MSEPVDPRDTILDPGDGDVEFVYHLGKFETATREEIEYALAKLSQPGMERRRDDE